MLQKQQISEKPDEQLVALQIAGETYGIDISCIHSIIRMQEITRVPQAPHFVEGVTNLRGSVIPVVDLRKRFDLPVTEPTKSTRIVVVDMEEKTVGMIVDGVSEVMRIPGAAIDPPSPIVAGISSEYIRGVGKSEDRLVILLDLPAVLSEAVKPEPGNIAAGGERLAA
ncbi:MAG TPA: chemotaxis protein CheW [Armatimonadota bacterium]|nr:chemotaxis protein CheW [Armatimonadota bacterium]